MKYKSELDDPILDALKTAYFSKLAASEGKYNEKRKAELDELENAIQDRRRHITMRTKDEVLLAAMRILSQHIK